MVFYLIIIYFYLGLSNKENNWTTTIALTSLKNNIPCNNQNCEYKWHYENLPNERGF